ncbi:MAG: transposase [Paraglaciecola sp.]|jgi:transposase
MIYVIEYVSQDAENGLSAQCRTVIYTAKELLKELIIAVQSYDDCLEKSVVIHCDKRLLKLEGVGTINVINHYLALSCSEIGVFSKGKDAVLYHGMSH